MKNVFVWWAEFGTQCDLSMMAGIRSLANEVHLQLLHIAALEPSAFTRRGTVYRPP